MGFSEAFANVFGSITMARDRKRSLDLQEQLQGMQEQMIPLQKEELYARTKALNMQNRYTKWRAGIEASNPYAQLTNLVPLAQGWASVAGAQASAENARSNSLMAAAQIKATQREIKIKEADLTQRQEAFKTFQDFLKKDRADDADKMEAADALTMDMYAKTGFALPPDKYGWMKKKFASLYDEMVKGGMPEELAAQYATQQFQKDYGQNIADMLSGTTRSPVSPEQEQAVNQQYGSFDGMMQSLLQGQIFPGKAGSAGAASVGGLPPPPGASGASGLPWGADPRVMQSMINAGVPMMDIMNALGQTHQAATNPDTGPGNMAKVMSGLLYSNGHWDPVRRVWVSD